MPNVRQAAFELEQSPLFNLSLSSKELFHSNFLHWLCKSYPEEVIPIFSQRMPEQPNALSNCDIRREKNDHDLTFRFGDGKVLVVENKVKSPPTKEQLQKYAKKYQGKSGFSFLLLSLTRPPNTPEGKIQVYPGVNWAVMDYLELARELDSRVAIVTVRNPYHGQLISDYVRFIELLAAIGNSSSPLSESRPNFFEFEEAMPNLVRLRIHDLVYKRVYSDMARFVRQRLDHSGNKVQDETHPSKGRRGQIFVDSNFTNGTGMFTVYYIVAGSNEQGGPCRLAIQLQNHMFRLFVAGLKRVKRSRNISEAIAEKGLWFNFDHLPTSSVIMRKKKEKPFNKFDADFYRYRLVDNISPEQLADTIIRYVEQAKDNSRRIQRIVKKPRLTTRRSSKYLVRVDGNQGY